MNAPSLPWVIGIGVTLAVFVVLLVSAIWQHLNRPEPPRHRALSDEEILERAQRAWQAFAETHDYGPCRYCRTSECDCVPVRPCCNRCAVDPCAHPIVDKSRSDDA